MYKYIYCIMYMIGRMKQDFIHIEQSINRPLFNIHNKFKWRIKIYNKPVSGARTFFEDILALDRNFI